MEFTLTTGVSVESKCLVTGDYGCLHKDGTMDKAVIERKSIPDLFSSFTHNYDNEKAKIERAKKEGIRYILAIEGSALDVRKGCTYWKGGEEHRVKKDGLTQLRQIMTLHKRGDIDEVWWCRDRSEMAFMIQEYFLAEERIKLKQVQRSTVAG